MPRRLKLYHLTVRLRCGQPICLLPLVPRSCIEVSNTMQFYWIAFFSLEIYVCATAYGGFLEVVVSSKVPKKEMLSSRTFIKTINMREQLVWSAESRLQQGLILLQLHFSLTEFRLTLRITCESIVSLQYTLYERTVNTFPFASYSSGSSSFDKEKWLSLHKSLLHDDDSIKIRRNWWWWL